MTAKTIQATGVAESERVLDVLHRQAPKLCGLGITRLSLFGSMARGETGPKSDVDLLVEIDPASRFTLFDLVDLQDDLRTLLGRPAHFAFAQSCGPGCTRRSSKRQSLSTDEASP